MPPRTTPDGRYLIVRGRLWRASNPDLPEAERQRLVDALMHARRAVQHAQRSDDAIALAEARRDVDAAKHALGERGPVWWTDGAQDYNGIWSGTRRMRAGTRDRIRCAIESMHVRPGALRETRARRTQR